MRTIIILILYVVIAILSLPMYLIEAIVRLISPRAAAHIAQVIVKGSRPAGGTGQGSHDVFPPP